MLFTDDALSTSTQNLTSNLTTMLTPPGRRYTDVELLRGIFPDLYTRALDTTAINNARQSVIDTIEDLLDIRRGKLPFDLASDNWLKKSRLHVTAPKHLGDGTGHTPFSLGLNNRGGPIGHSLTTSNESPTKQNNAAAVKRDPKSMVFRSTTSGIRKYDIDSLLYSKTRERETLFANGNQLHPVIH